VVAAGSVVVRSVPDGVVAAGNPAEVVRRIDGSREEAAAPGESAGG